MAELIPIQIAYLTPEQQWCKILEVPAGSTIQQALNQADFFKQCPEITVHNINVGIHGIQKRLSDVLKPKNRIEVYRPLICNPKKVRLSRAKT